MSLDNAILAYRIKERTDLIQSLGEIKKEVEQTFGQHSCQETPEEFRLEMSIMDLKINYWIEKLGLYWEKKDEAERPEWDLK